MRGCAIYICTCKQKMYAFDIHVHVYNSILLSQDELVTYWLCISTGKSTPVHSSSRSDSGFMDRSCDYHKNSGNPEGHWSGTSRSKERNQWFYCEQTTVCTHYGSMEIS